MHLIVLILLGPPTRMNEAYILTSVQLPGACLRVISCMSPSSVIPAIWGAIQSLN